MLKCNKRYDELNDLTAALYENYIAGKISERQYRTLMERYDKEQTDLEGKIASLSGALNAKETKEIQPERFIELINKYKNITELDRSTVSELVDKIVIYPGVGQKPNRQQQVDIYFNFIGKYDLVSIDELSKK